MHRSLKSMQLHSRFRLAPYDNALASVKAELQIITVQCDRKRPSHLLHIPANQLATPSAAEKVSSITTELRNHRARFVVAQCAHFTSQHVQQMDRAAMVGQAEPKPARMPVEIDHLM